MTHFKERAVIQRTGCDMIGALDLFLLSQSYVHLLDLFETLRRIANVNIGIHKSLEHNGHQEVVVKET